MGLLYPSPQASILYQSDSLIPFSQVPLFPRGFTALMLRVGAVSDPYKKFNFLGFCLSRLHYSLNAFVPRAERGRTLSVSSES